MSSAAPTNVYKPGQTVRLSAAVTSAGAPFNPVTMAAAVRLPDGSTLTPSVVQDAAGIYHADFLIPFAIVLPDGVTQSLGLYRFQASGSSPPDGYGVTEGAFYVAPLDF